MRDRPLGLGSWVVEPLLSCDLSLPLQCIVQSYLQWLQDSDYSSNCRLCNTPLASRETTRLVCYGESWGFQDRPVLVAGFHALRKQQDSESA